MVNIFEYNRKLAPLNKTSLNRMLKESVLEQKNLILDLQKIQLEKGEGDKGEVIGYYSEATELISGGRKRAGDPYDFQDTGSFFRRMFVKVVTRPKFIVVIDSKDPKTDELEMKYGGLFGQTLLGIQDKNKDEIIIKIRESFFRKLNKILR